MATSTPVNCNSTGSHKFRVYIANASDNAELTETTYKRSLTTRGEFYNNTTSTWSVSGTVATTFTPSKTFSYESSIATTTKSSSFSSVGVASKSTDYSNTTSNYNHAVTFKRTCESYTITNKTIGTINSYTTTYTGSAVTIAARTKYTITYNLNKTGAVHATGYQTYCTACGGDHKSYGYSAKLYTNSSGTALTPTCDGYKFLGWSTSSTATTATYQSGDAYSTNANLTLYAVWKSDTQKPSTPTITVGNINPIPAAPALLGLILTFASTDDTGITGYYWGTSSSTSVTFTSVTSTTNWSMNYPHRGTGTYYLRVKDAAGNISDYTSMTFYQISFSVTNGTPIDSRWAGGATLPGGYTLTLPGINPDSGYTSPGYWSYNGSNVGAVGDSYTTPYSARTLTAVCRGSTTVTLNLNGGTGIGQTAYSYETSGTFGGGSSYLSYPLGYTAENPHSYTSPNIYASSGTTAYATYSFDFSSIPSDASIQSVTVQCNGARESTTDDSTHVANLDLYTGATLKASSKFTSTSNETITISGGSWTRAQLLNAKLRFTVGYYGGRLCGVTWIVKYSSSSDLTKTLYQGETTNNIVEIGVADGTFLGWYTAVSGGTQVFDANGKWVSNATSYWDSSGQWNYSDSTLTLYARWKTYTLTANANGGTIPSTSGWLPSGGASSQKTKPIHDKASWNDSAYWPVPTRTNYIFLGWFSSSTAFTNTTKVTGPDGEVGDFGNPDIWDYYDETGWVGTTDLTLYAGWEYNGTYTLTIQYHLNGGTIADRVHQYSSNYYRFDTESRICDCDSNGGNSTIHETTVQCKTSESQTTYVNLLNYGTYGASRYDPVAGAAITPVGNAEYKTANGTLINQDGYSSGSTNVASVYRLLDNNNITENTTIMLYINWNTSKYALDIQYQLNDGTIADAPHQSGSNYYTYTTSGAIFDCNSSGNQRTIHRTHTECTSANSSSTYVNLLNISTFNGTRSGYYVNSTEEYVTDGGNLINQDGSSSGTTNAASVYRLLDNHNITQNTVITISINWISNTATIYVKTTDGWKKGIVYIKTDQGWKQGTPYIKTTNGWKQGI